MTLRLRGAALVVLALSACGSTQAPPPAPPPEQDTSIGIGDVFDVRVYGEESLTNTYRVSEDGSIDFPFIGRVAVVGLEPSHVAEQITQRLKEDGYLNDPQVSVFVREYNSKRVSVVGAVARPGTFPFTSGMTFVQAIGSAGGFTALASRNDAVLTRVSDGRTIRRVIHAGSIAQGQEEDVPLQAGDLVYVPERIF